MFQSCTYQYKSFDPTTDRYLYDITIVDPDFGEKTTVAAVAVLAASAAVSMAGVLTAEVAVAEMAAAMEVIKLYFDKGYSVNQIAKNLWLLFEFNQRQCAWWSIKDQINWCLKWVPEYQPYHETIQMLMLFS
jgi:hypothetical protein